MTAKQVKACESLSAYAREESENGRVCVTFHGGCFWLVLNPSVPGDCARILRAVGTESTGLKYAKEQIKNYFAEK